VEIFSHYVLPIQSTEDLVNNWVCYRGGHHPKSPVPGGIGGEGFFLNEGQIPIVLSILSFWAQGLARLVRLNAIFPGFHGTLATSTESP
jgi:hypothetical protein